MNTSAQTPPADLDAERAVLSALLLAPERLPEVRQVISSRHFYADSHRRVYESIVNLAETGRAVDTISVAGQLRDLGRLDQIGGTPYLAELVDATPAVAHVADHARSIREKWRLRALADVCRSTAAEVHGAGDVERILAQHARGIDAICAKTDTPERRIKLTCLESVIGDPEEPIEWVWDERRQVAPGRPYILGAYGGIGKTWLVLAMALSVATGIEFLGARPPKGGKAIVLSYETGKRRLLRRIRRLVRGYSIGSSLENLHFAAQEDLTLFLNSPEAEAELTSMCEGVTLLVVDALLQGSPGLKENDAEISTPLHMLARVSARTNCAIVVIHHERKSNEENGSAPAGQALRGHSSINGACDATWGMRSLNDGWVAVRATKTSDGPRPQGWDVKIVDVDGGGVVIEHRDAVTEASLAGTDDLDGKVLAAVRETPGASGRTVRVAVGGRHGAVSDALARLELAGSVESRPGTKNSTTWWPTSGAASE